MARTSTATFDKHPFEKDDYTGGQLFKTPLA